jgi:hypothetical protein
MRPLLLLLLLSTALSAQSAPPPTWQVIYISGPMIPRTEKIRVTVYSDRLSFETKKHLPVLDISADQITDIVYSPVRFSRRQQLGGFTGPFSTWAGCGLPGCGMAVLFQLTAVLAVSPMHGHSHFVTVDWTDHGVDQEIMFEARKNDFITLTNALRQFAGVKWLDLEAEGRRVRQEITQNREKAVPISLDRLSKVGDFDLTAGQYNVLALDRTNGNADVYFFTDRVEATAIKAVIKTESTQSCAPTSVEYTPNTVQVAAIHLPGKTLRIPAAR